MLKFRTIAAVAAMAFTASVWAADVATVDCTNLVKTGVSDWGGKAEFNHSVTTADGRSVKMVERYSDNKADFPAGNTPLVQTVAVENGKYHVTVYARSFNAWNKCPLEGTSMEVVAFFANDVEVPVEARKQNDYAGTNPEEYTAVVNVTDGTLKMGLKMLVGEQTNWHTIQIKSLAREVAEDEALAAAKDAAQAALDAEEFVNVTGNERTDLAAALAKADVTSAELNAAVEAFKGAKAAYNKYAALAAKVEAFLATSLATEAANSAVEATLAAAPKTAAEATTAFGTVLAAYRLAVESDAIAEGVEGRVDCTSYIVNPKAEDGLNGWTLAQKDGGASLAVKDSEKAADSKGEYKYFDGGNWGGSDWTTRFEQTVKDLPAGKYRIAVMARASENLRWFRLRLNNNEATQVDLTHKGASLEDAHYANSYNEHVLDFTSTGDLLISVQANTNTKYQWQGFTNFRLTKVGDIENPNRDAYEAALEAALAALENEEYEAVMGEEFENLFDLANPETAPSTDDEYIAATAELKAALDAFVAAVPAYNKFVAANEKAYGIADSCTDASDAALEALIDIEAPFNADEAEAGAEAFVAAYRAILHSHSLAEGVEGAVNMTSLIQNAKAEAAEGWTAAQADGGSKISVMTNSAGNFEPATDHEGVNHNYFDGGNWGGNDWTSRYEQTIADVPAGKYRISVFARGSENLRWFRLCVGEMPKDDNNLGAGVDLSKNGSAAEAHFGRGWSDHNYDFDHAGGDLTFAVCGASKTSHQWHSFTNFRLVQLGTLTGVENIAVDAEADDEAIFDLAGRRVVNPEAGLYIKGGKKVYIRK